MDNSGTGDLVNVAVGKPARQSSLSSFSTPNDARGACNGRKNGRYGFHTSLENNPWWEVDLLNVTPIEEIVIFNRLDAGKERAFNFVLKIGLRQDNLSAVHSQNGKDFGGVDGNPARLRLSGKLARYIRIELEGHQYLHLDEVEIYARSSGIADRDSDKEADDEAISSREVIYARRSDGLGTRLLTIMYARLAAERSQRELRIIWPDLIDSTYYINGKLTEKDVRELFDDNKVFCNAKDVGGEIFFESEREKPHLPVFSECINDRSRISELTRGSFIYDLPFPLIESIGSYQKDEIVDIWNDINWSKTITDVVSHVEESFGIRHAIGVHVRRGDIIQKIVNPDLEHLKQTAAQIYQRYVPLSYYFEAIEKNRTSEKILVFSDDVDIYREFQSRFGAENIIKIDFGNLSFNQLTAAELILMSRVKFLISPCVSFFSRCAQAVCSGKFENLTPSIVDVFRDLSAYAGTYAKPQLILKILYEEAAIALTDEQDKARLDSIYDDAIGNLG